MYAPIAVKEPHLRLATEPAPIDARLFQQRRAEHNIAIPTSYALSDMIHHPLAVDVPDL